ncbi:MAG: DPP IV N-terminal domain-containing protein [Planctomycetes bacterium]|nr:DPP IV N-terminal domain-containing protein [Planctomycetota bacterium]
MGNAAVRSFALLLLVAGLPGQEGRLDAQRVAGTEFAAERFGPARWLDGAHFATLEPKPGTEVLELVRYEAVSGAREVVVSAAMLWVDRLARALGIEDYTFSPDGTQILVFTQSERVWRQNTRGEFFVLALDGKSEPRRLGGDLPISTLQFAKWSPDGTRVAYVAQNDLWVEQVATGKRTRLTKDGSRTTINGTFDWVYEEEFDCRDGFRWSPDGTSIAFWQLDCSGVGEFVMVDNLADRYAQVVPVQYPKAGTTNSACRIGVLAADGAKQPVWMQTPGDPRETYLPRMEWHPDSKELMVQWLPRAQNHLVVYAADVATGAVRVVHEERDEAYIDVRDDFRWLGQGADFFWTSDSAFHDGKGPRYRQCGSIRWNPMGGQWPLVAWTSGYDVIEVLWVGDPSREPSLRGPDVLCTVGPVATQKLLRVSGRNLADGSQAAEVVAEAWHDFIPNPDGTLAIRTSSSFDQPPVVDLVRLPKQEVVRVLVDNEALRARYAKVDKGTNEFFTVAIDGGVTLDGFAMYPKDFDPTKSWPVVFHVYGEPWSQTVMDRWDLKHHLFHRWLTQLGYVVMSVDARGTPAPKGRDWRKALFQKIGVTSSADWNAAVTKLCEQHAWMDRSRLAIWGWSGGGAMTLNMLFRYPDLFTAGMSVAPVTDVALYDTIYQERYCGDPRQFPEVYRQCSPITFAKNLKAPLLLVHGTGDDNVHYQHTERLVDTLVAHGKRFEMLAYPNRTHAIRERDGTRAHLYDALADFLQRRVPAGPRAK